MKSAQRTRLGIQVIRQHGILGGCNSPNRFPGHETVFVFLAGFTEDAGFERVELLRADAVLLAIGGSRDRRPVLGRWLTGRVQAGASVLLNWITILGGPRVAQGVN